MFDIILKYTNKFGEKIYCDQLKHLDLVELKGFIGCILYMGIYKDNTEPIKELFGFEEGRKIYRDVF